MANDTGQERAIALRMSKQPRLRRMMLYHAKIRAWAATYQANVEYGRFLALCHAVCAID